MKRIVIMIFVVLLCIGSYYLITKGNNNSTGNNDNKNISNDKKILVVYYSATGSTKKVAEEIAENLNADIFEIEPKDAYTSADLNWSNDNSRVSREHNSESLRNVELKNTKVSDWDSYDIVLIGYPIWWGIAAWPVDNFVTYNDFTGKTIITFCTSASSPLGESGKLLKEMAKTGTWVDGKRFSSNSSSETIKEWTDSLVKENKND